MKCEGSWSEDSHCGTKEHDIDKGASIYEYVGGIYCNGCFNDVITDETLDSGDLTIYGDIDEWNEFNLEQTNQMKEKDNGY